MVQNALFRASRDCHGFNRESHKSVKVSCDSGAVRHTHTVYVVTVCVSVSPTVAGQSEGVWHKSV